MLGKILNHKKVCSVEQGNKLDFGKKFEFFLHWWKFS